MFFQRFLSCILGVILIALVLGPTSTLQASEKHLYDFLWLDPDKKVYVLQKKVYKKKRTFYANIGYLSGLDSDYLDVSGFLLGLGYYVNEQWAIELFYHHYINKDNETQGLLKEDEARPFIRKFEHKVGGMIRWSPFYGKINTFNKIIYFDWSFGLGGGKLRAKANSHLPESDTKLDKFESESFSALFLKTAFRIYINKRFHVGMEYHRNYYKGAGPYLDSEPGSKPINKKLRFYGEAIFLTGLSF